jgi:hypothetical protein
MTGDCERASGCRYGPASFDLLDAVGKYERLGCESAVGRWLTPLPPPKWPAGHVALH